jgi:hypothetical protein
MAARTAVKKGARADVANTPQPIVRERTHHAPGQHGCSGDSLADHPAFVEATVAALSTSNNQPRTTNAVQKRREKKRKTNPADSAT